MAKENSNIKLTAQEAREQLIAIGGEITSTSLKINGHFGTISTKNTGTDGIAFKVACIDYSMPREYRDAMEEREFTSAAEAKAFLEAALDIYDSIYDSQNALLFEKLGKI